MEEQKEEIKAAAAQWAHNFSQMASMSQIFFKALLEKRLPPSSLHQMIYFNQVYQKFIRHLMANPEKLVNLQVLYWQELFFLWQRFMLNHHENEAQDKRFENEAWQQQPFFHFVKDFYLLHTRHFQGLLQMTEGLDDKTKQQIQFYLKQIAEAAAPTNFVATNPEVWRMTLETRGENLLKGLDNALADLNQDNEHFQIKMTDSRAFEIGKNLAITPGKVIYQNALMQVLQYEPQTKKVYQRPLLIVPPWINKYYILDLTPELSLVNWLVQKGYTVFMISWVNPDQRQAQKDFADYLFEGPLQALDVIEQATGEREVNALGYCVGGSLLSCALAYLAHQGERRLVSATYLCALLDFSEPGEIGAFIDENQFAALEVEMHRKGYFDGRELAATFNLLRPHDLIWSYYVKNYLLGESPAPHELLFWNGDSTHIPKNLHRFYLRNFYLDNRLKESQGLNLQGIPIDLKRIEAPVCFISTLQDHIAPWKSVYAGLQLHSGPVNFILGKSGHIAGVINPPVRNKYSYYTNSTLTESAETWLKDAKEESGSWWPCWEKWLRKQSGDLVSACQPGGTGLAWLEEAPGSYVKVKIKEREREIV